VRTAAALSWRGSTLTATAATRPAGSRASAWRISSPISGQTSGQFV